MPRPAPRTRVAAVLALALLCAGLATAKTKAKKAPAKPAAAPASTPEVKTPKKEAAKPAEPASPFAGAEACETCHADAAESYAKTVHARALADESRPEAERGCEACHGPGQGHIDEGGGVGVAIRGFAKSDPVADRSAPCLHCHGGESALHDYVGGEHAKSGVACTDCHDPHNGVGEAMLAKPETKLCTSCHLDVKSKFVMPEHHKVNEGVVACTDCHQPHGSRNAAMTKDANDTTCLRCHGELEGPFVFEHAGLLSEGCQRCHEPHGGTGRHLLVRQQVAQLCSECHTVTPPTHLQPKYRDCTRCHTSIHGSNVDPHFLEQ